MANSSTNSGDAGAARVVAPEPDGADETLERSLRPNRLADLVGQPGLKDALTIALTAAQRRGEPPDHLLFYGPPGLGKTTLARIVAAELGVNLRSSSGPAIARPGDLAGILTTLQEGDVFFIDEMHRLPHAVEEVLYPAMEDFALDLLIGKGPGARSVRLQVKPFTLVGATTRYAMISSPLRDRFGMVQRLEFYQPHDLAGLVRTNAVKLKIPISDDGAETLAHRARGTPRIANRLLRRVRDYAEVRGDGTVDATVADTALAQLGVDRLGLDDRDRGLLRTLIERFGGGPVGLETLAASVAEESDTVMDVYEPYLLQLGFLQRTPRGRVATPAAWRHLGFEPPENAPGTTQPSLFGPPADEAPPDGLPDESPS
jgi:Holliday junction DNA helicase RuvB